MEPPELPGYDIGTRYASATEQALVGGDFYDFIFLGNGKAGIVIGDVQGKGVEAAVTMDPTLVGTYRLLGELYAQLKDTARAQEFYIQYLRARPAGPLAELVRHRLKDNPALGKVTFTASFPSAVYINRFKLDPKRVTPFTDVLLPEGTYTVIMHNAQYYAARKIKVTVKAGERRTVTFEFGLVDIKLAPWARVRANGRDLGLWNPIGMPADRYRLVFTSHDEKKTMTKEIELKPGQRFEISKWE